MSYRDPLELIEPLLADPDIGEIMVDGCQRVYVEKHGKLIDVPTPFENDAQVLELINAIFAPLGRQVNESTPLGDARLADGSRVNAVIPPIALTGPTLTIRKFRKKPLTVEDLIGYQSMNQDIVDFLKLCLEARLNMVISGGTGSGKTTVMNVIASFLPKGERVITVENAAEMRLQHDRVISLESRPPDIDGKGEVTIQDLVINALRMRPDRIIVGELRGPEALDVIHAMNTGYDGSMFTIHANGPRDVLSRLEVMCQMAGFNMPLLAIREHIAKAIQVIVYQERLPDGTRKIMKIAEVTGMEGQIIALTDIFEFRQTGVQDGKIVGKFTPTGYIPSFLPKMRAMGIDISMDLFTPR